MTQEKCNAENHDYRLKTRILNNEHVCVQSIYNCRKCGELKTVIENEE